MRSLLLIQLCLLLWLPACGRGPTGRDEPEPAPSPAVSEAPSGGGPSPDSQPVEEKPRLGLRLAGEDAARPGSGELVPPVAVHRPNPSFRGFSGDHLVRPNGIYDLRIDAGGQVESARVIRSAHPGLDEEVLATLRQWRFKPATLEGKPVAVDDTVTLQIHLR